MASAVRSPLSADEPQCAKAEARRAARFAKLAAEVNEFECQLPKVSNVVAEKKTGPGYAAKKKSEDPKIYTASKTDKVITGDLKQQQNDANVVSSDVKSHSQPQPEQIVKQTGPQSPEDFGHCKVIEKF